MSTIFNSLFFPLFFPLLALCFAVWLVMWIMKKDQGTAEMKKVAEAIREGAGAFLRRQYRTIAIICAVIALAIWAAYSFSSKPELGWQTALAFILGAASSAVSGIIGMATSVRSNARSASAARRSFNEALTVALRGGAVSGITIVALSLIGIAGLFGAYRYFGYDVVKIPAMIAGYGFGASLVALFAQLGGGIYTKAADVGADLVGKIEAGIPEDDPRNPA